MVVGLDARPVVAHRDVQPRALLAHGDDDRAGAAIVVLDRVGDQVQQYLVQRRAVGAQRPRLPLQRDLEQAVGVRQVADLVDQLADVGVAQGVVDPARLGVVEQVGLQLGEPPGPREQRLEVVEAVLRQGVARVLDGPGGQALDRAQRRAHVVGCRVGELLQLVVRAPELPGVVAEYPQRPRDVPDLVLAVHLDRALGVARGDAQHLVGELAEALVDLAFHHHIAGREYREQHQRHDHDEDGQRRPGHRAQTVGQPGDGALDFRRGLRDAHRHRLDLFVQPRAGLLQVRRVGGEPAGTIEQGAVGQDEVAQPPDLGDDRVARRLVPKLQGGLRERAHHRSYPLARRLAVDRCSRGRGDRQGGVDDRVDRAHDRGQSILPLQQLLDPLRVRRFRRLRALEIEGRPERLRRLRAGLDDRQPETLSQALQGTVDGPEVILVGRDPPADGQRLLRLPLGRTDGRGERVDGGGVDASEGTHRVQRSLDATEESVHGVGRGEPVRRTVRFQVIVQTGDGGQVGLQGIRVRQ